MYRGAYACTDAIRDRSRADLGYCGVEKEFYESAIKKGLWFLYKSRLEDATEEEQRKVLAFAEAAVYRHRAFTAYFMVQAGKAEAPDAPNALRYLTGGLNATSARQAAILGDQMPEVAPTVPPI